MHLPLFVIPRDRYINRTSISLHKLKKSSTSIVTVSSVSEILQEKETITISTDSGKTAQDVASLMVKKKVSSVIVIDKKGQHLGIITKSDLVKRVCLKNVAASRIKVEEIMSSPLITIMSFDSIDTASRIMTKNNIKQLAVLEEDYRIAGLLSATDIMRRLAKILLDDYNRYRSLRFAIDLS